MNSALALSCIYDFKTSKMEYLKLVLLVSSLILVTLMSLLCLDYNSRALLMCWWFLLLELMWHLRYQVCDAFIQTALKQPKFGVDVRGCSSSSLQLQLNICGINAARSKTTFPSPATQLKTLTYQQKTEWKGYKVNQAPGLLKFLQQILFITSIIPEKKKKKPTTTCYNYLEDALWAFKPPLSPGQQPLRRRPADR